MRLFDRIVIAAYRIPDQLDDRRRHHMRKMVFAAGIAVGYVLGARAGRQRYEAIARTASRVWSSQTVQSAAGVLREQAAQKLPVDALREKLHRLPVPSHNGAEHR
jgi:hypothetical protein